MRKVIIGLVCLGLAAGIYCYMAFIKGRADAEQAGPGPARMATTPRAGTPVATPSEPAAAKTGRNDESAEPDMVIGLEMNRDSQRPDVTVGVKDVGGAKVNANLTQGTAEISAGQRDKEGEGFLGKVQVDKKGGVEGRVEYGVRF